jgi:hypothetical protein
MSHDASVYQSLQCLICYYKLDGAYCVAYPLGMPPEVLAGVVPCPGGNGVKFKLKNEEKGERRHLKTVK